MNERPEEQHGSAPAPGGAEDRGGRRAPMSNRDVVVLRSLADRIDPTDAGAHNNLGVVFYQKGLVEEAVSSFERALDLNPQLDVARVNARVALRHGGLLKRRTRELEHRLARAPDDGAIAESLARTYLLGGDPDAAVRVWARLLERRPDSAAIHAELARAQAERGLADEAVRLLERAAELTPEDPGIHLQRAELLHQRGANAHAEQAVRRALQLDEDDATAHDVASRILAALGRREEAAAERERADALDPRAAGAGHLSLERYLSAPAARAQPVDDADASHEPEPPAEPEPAPPPEPEPGPAPVEATLGRIARANQLRRRGDDGAAREVLEQALAGDPDNAEIRQALAELHLLAGRLATAETEYARLSRERADSPKLWNERGVVLHRLGRLDEAVEAYRRTVALDHAYSLGWSNLGVALVQRGENGAAERALRQATADGPPVEVLWNLALFLTRGDRPDEAVDACRRALDLDRGVAEAWSRFGGALFQANRPAEARDALLKALDLDPELAEARYQLGFALSALGDFKGALRETKLALERDPLFPAPRFRLLIDVQFESGSLPAPDAGIVERVGAGTPIKDFRVTREDLDRAFAGFTPPPPDRPAAFEDALRDAREALRRGRLERASDRAARAAALSPASPEALLLQGEVFLRRGLAGEALERYDAVQRTGGVDYAGDAAVGRARCLLVLGRLDAAIEAAEDALAGGREEGLRLLARALLEAGQADRAVSVFESTLEQGDDSPATLVGYGTALVAAGRPADAEPVLRRALDRAPNAVAGRLALGRALASRGNATGAERQFGAAVRMLPSYGEAVLELAELQWREGRRQSAVRTVVDFLELDPTHVEGLARLGTWLREVGRPDQAEAALRRALRFDPSHAGANRELERIGAAAGG